MQIREGEDPLKSTCNTTSLQRPEGSKHQAVLNSSRQPPTRRVVPPVPVVLAVVLRTNHAHPLVMTTMNRGPWQRSMRTLRKSLLNGRRCGTLSTRKTLWTSTMNTDGLLNSRRCGTLSLKTSTSTSTTTVRNRSVDMFCSTTAVEPCPWERPGRPPRAPPPRVSTCSAPQTAVEPCPWERPGRPPRASLPRP